MRRLTTILILVSTWRSFSSEFQDSERETFVRSAPSADACPFTRSVQGFQSQFVQVWRTLQTRETILESAVERSAPHIPQMELSRPLALEDGRHRAVRTCEARSATEAAAEPVTQGSGITKRALSMWATSTWGRSPSWCDEKLWNMQRGTACFRTTCSERLQTPVCPGTNTSRHRTGASVPVCLESRRSTQRHVTLRAFSWVDKLKCSVKCQQRST